MKSAISINNFLKVIIAAKRAKQLRIGARTLVQSSSTRATLVPYDGVDVVTQAIRELNP
jgi:DNA-directed RNA polymerase subunit K/omega